MDSHQESPRVSMVSKQSENLTATRLRFERYFDSLGIRGAVRDDLATEGLFQYWTYSVRSVRPIEFEAALVRKIGYPIFVKHIDKRRRTQEALLGFAESGAADRDSSIDLDELRDRIREMLDRVDVKSPEIRTGLEHHLEGRTIEEIAKRHGVHRATVYRWLKAGLERLREAYDE